jgi:hypothetical protein
VGVLAASALDEVLSPHIAIRPKSTSRRVKVLRAQRMGAGGVSPLLSRVHPCQPNPAGRPGHEHGIEERLPVGFSLVLERLRCLHGVGLAERPGGIVF